MSGKRIKATRGVEKELRKIHDRMRRVQEVETTKTIDAFLIAVRQEPFWKRVKFCWRILRKK